MQNQNAEQRPLLGSARVVLWDPKGSNRFVVGGGAELKMYEWNHEKSEVKLAGIRSDLQAMQCFAWSPHSVYNDFLAVGLQTGVVDICRLDQAVPTSATSFQTAQPPVSLSMASVRNKPKPCTSLAFCRLNPNLLANGLDRSRSEYALLIWDLEQAAPVFEASAIDDHFDKLSNPLPNPGNHSRAQRSSLHLHPRSIASSNATAHGMSQDHQRVASRGKMSSQRSLQEGSSIPRGQYCLSEGINSCIFQHNSSWEVVAGVNNKLIRYFDLRVPDKAVSEAATRAVRGICCETTDGNLIASLDEIGVHVWDRRKHTHPVLVFQEEDAGVDNDAMIMSSIPHPPLVGKITSVEFCNTRRNVLGTTTQGGSYVRLWDLITGGSYTNNQIIDDNYSDAADASPQPPQEWANRVGHPGSLDSSGAPQEATTEGHAPVLYDTRRTKIFKRPVASFDFIPRNAAPNSPPHIVAVSNRGDVELSVIRDSPRHTWSVRGELLASVGNTYKTYRTHGAVDAEPQRESWDNSLDDEVVLPLKREPAFSADVEPLVDATGHLTVQENAPRKYSPSSILRMPFDKKPRPDSIISTPRPLAVPLDSEDSVVAPKAHLTESARPIAIPLRTSHPRGHSARRSERNMTEHGLLRDISVVIRRRVLRDYGLESARANSEIIKEEMDDTESLSATWLWLHTSHKVLQPHDLLTHIHGFDFTLKGIAPIWEGFKPLPRLAVEPPKPPTQWQAPIQRRRQSSALSATAPRIVQDRRFGNYAAALEWINRRNNEFRADMVTLPKASLKLPQRRLGLSLVGWNAPDRELEDMIEKWENERASARAACWAIFMGKSQCGVDILGRSYDERHRLLSAVMIAGLQLERSENSKAYVQWREKCQSLATRLDDPYGRMLLSWLTTKDWRETMLDLPIPLSEKVGIALRFFDDDDVSEFLKETIKTATENGDLSGIILTGINEDAIRILQSYVDHTGDVQTAAIMAALAPSLYVQEKQTRRPRSEGINPVPPYHDDQAKPSPENAAIAKQIEGWLDAYTELLDSWKLFHFRAKFDIDRGQLVMLAMSPRKATPESDGTVTGEVVGGPIERMEWVPRQLELRCMSCGTAVGVSGPKTLPEVANGTVAVAACPECKQRLPRCVICRMYMSFPGEPVDHLLHNPNADDTIDESLIFCQTCRHGGHANHILGWFFGASTANGEGRKHDTCPVAGCNCRCLDE